MAALFNALKIIDKPIEGLRVLMVGLGAAGVAVTKMMLAAGLTHVVGCDRKGALSVTREDYQAGELGGSRSGSPTTRTRPSARHPDEVIEGMDVFVGLSGPGIIQPESLGKMNRDPIVFAMSNPDPEVAPRRPPSTCGSWPPAAPTTRTRSTTRALSGIFRGALSTPARHRSPRR